MNGTNPPDNTEPLLPWQQAALEAHLQQRPHRALPAYLREQERQRRQAVCLPSDIRPYQKALEKEIHLLASQAQVPARLLLPIQFRVRPRRLRQLLRRLLNR